MPKRAKQQAPTEVETFQAEYMKALNDKFKLRGQLAALMNQLEDLRVLNARLEEDIVAKEARASAAKPPATPQPTPLRPATPVAVPTPPVQHPQRPSAGPHEVSSEASLVRPPSLAPLTALPPEPSAPKIAHKPRLPPPTPTATPAATQTTQPEPQTLFPENPIKGLPLIIRDFDAPPPTPQAKTPSTPGSLEQKDFDSQRAPRKRPKRTAAFKDEDEGIYMEASDDDDVVTVVKPTGPLAAASTAELEAELVRLRRRFDEITFYAVVIVFAIFAFMLLKEMRVLLTGKPTAAPAAPARPRAQYRSWGGEDDGADDVHLQVKLEAKAPPASSHPRSAGPGKIVLRPAPPCAEPSPPCVEAPPVIEVKCGELENSLKRYDCDECNQNLVGLSS